MSAFFKPFAVRSWEFLVMRCCLALVVWDAVPWFLDFDGQPKPTGIAHFVDLSFLSDRSVLKGINIVLIPVLLLYVIGYVPVVTLTLMLTATVLTGTFNNSQMAMTHHLQIVSLVLFAQWITYLYHTVRDPGTLKQHSGFGNMQAPQRDLWAIYNSLQAAVAAYVVSGISKLNESGWGWIRDAANFPIQLKKANQSQYYNTLEAPPAASAGFLETLPVKIEALFLMSPNLCRFLISLGLFLELFVVLALLGKRWAAAYGSLLILFHLTISNAMSLNFRFNIYILLIFFVFPFMSTLIQKYWPRRSVNANLILLLGAVSFFFAGCGNKEEKKEYSPYTPAVWEDAEAVHYRCVWVRSSKEKDAWLKREGHTIVGIDNQDGKGERLFTEEASFAKPIMAPNGEFFVYGKRVSAKNEAPRFELVYQPWEGEAKVLGPGSPADIVEDASGKTWIYAGRNLVPASTHTASKLVRFSLDDPSAVETVWERTDTGLDNAQVSDDGRLLAACFPWPDGAVANVQKGSLTPMGHGCWTSMSPGDNPIPWLFDGKHRNLTIFLPGENRRQININSAPGVNGYEVYHPRWSNHPGFFACTGPYTNAEGGMKVGGGGHNVEVFIGQFDQGLTKVMDWIQVTDNKEADFYPSVWIEGGAGVDIDLDVVAAAGNQDLKPKPAPKLSEVWPGTHEGLVFLWENRKASNEIKATSGNLKCSLDAKGYSYFDSIYGMRIVDGSFQSPEPVGARISDALRDGDAFAMEFFMKPDGIGIKRGCIVDFAEPKPGNQNFGVFQEGKQLVFSIPVVKRRKTKNPVPILDVVDKKGVHVIVTFDGRRCYIYINGQQKYAKEGEWNGLSSWVPVELVFGQDASGDSPWLGHLDHVAIYNRVIDKEEAKEHYALFRKDHEEQKEVDQIRITGKLLAAKPTPKLANLGAYTRHLAGYTYEVTKVHSGTLKDKKVSVMHMVIMDNQILPEFPREIGKEYELTLEKFTDHPQLKSESQDMADDVDAETYFDVGFRKGK